MKHFIAIIVTLFVPYGVFMALVFGAQGLVESVKPNLVIIFAIPITILHLLVFVPIAILLDLAGKLNVWRSTILGFVVGCLIVGIYEWPYPDGAYIGQVEGKLLGKTIIASKDGYPTLFGWLIYFQLIILVGVVFGAPSGLTYGLITRRD